MTTVSNKTQRPMSLRLPRGKTLHLGPGKTAEIAANVADGPQLKKLVEAGEIEIDSAAARHGDGVGGGKQGRSFIGHSSGVSRRGGDR